MSIYDIKVKDMGGQDVSMSQFKGKVMLIINTATACGFTPQYNALQVMYEELKDKGFEVLDFPCNQFGSQAPGTEEEIHDFCTLRYDITFPQFAKIDVNGQNESPLFTFLKKEKGGLLGDKIKWNFTKFLVDENGNVVQRYGSTTKPDAIKKDILKLLSA